MLSFRPLTIADRDTLRNYIFRSGQRNCNLSFANLAAWQPIFNTQFATTDNALVLRYTFDDHAAYMLVFTDHNYEAVLENVLQTWQYADSIHEELEIVGMENEDADILRRAFGGQVTVEAIRSSQDYIYRRESLASLRGRHMQAKRNHANRFRSLYPHYEYRELTPDLFAQCIEVENFWHGETGHKSPYENFDTLAAEQRVMQFTFDHWDDLHTLGGALFVEGKMVAFTYGSAITATTFDVSMEKADTNYEGAFTVINQEFCRHLPEYYIYVNREEDMGLEGLRQAKSSYHPELLLSYNIIQFNENKEDSDSHSKRYCLHRSTPDDLPETLEWMVRQYGFEREEVRFWLENLHINWPLSVKAVDEDGQTIGLLTMSDYRIEEETAQMAIERPNLLKALNQYRYTAVFSFIVAPERRGTTLNFDMMMNIAPELKKYDFIFVPVMHHLKTHEYWKRWGAQLFYEDKECKYYLLPINPKVSEAIGIKG